MTGSSRGNRRGFLGLTSTVGRVLRFFLDFLTGFVVFLALVAFFLVVVFLVFLVVLEVLGFVFVVGLLVDLDLLLFVFDLDFSSVKFAT